MKKGGPYGPETRWVKYMTLTTATTDSNDVQHRWWHLTQLCSKVLR